MKPAADENTICVLGSLKEPGVFKMFRVPVGQSLEFDEGPGATRAWLWPHLGNGDWHLIIFVNKHLLDDTIPYVVDRIPF